MTVRTYDAEKSPELLDLFGYPDDTDQTQYRSKDIRCRHFKIPPLNEDEIRQTFDQIPHLESIYNKPGYEDFKRLPCKSIQSLVAGTDSKGPTGGSRF